jgi:putative Mg2+ transporter-C (MgtC) family protein
MLTPYELIFRMAVAVVLGGAIGYERELREQPAGLRTNLLVALASAMFMVVSSQFVFHHHYPNDGVIRADVGRIASNVVVGIGFLGGGAIVHAGMRIQGLTTAATLWLVAAIGLAAGAGMIVAATAATVMALFALVVLRYVVEAPRKEIVRLRLHLDMEGEFLSRAALIDFLKPLGAELCGIDYSRNLSSNRSKLEIYVKLAGAALEEPLMKRLESLPGIRRVRVERPDLG